METRINSIVDWDFIDKKFTVKKIKNIATLSYEIPESKNNTVMVKGKLYYIYSSQPVFGGDKLVSNTLIVYDKAIKNVLDKEDAKDGK